jgi:hypothetical protein
MDFFSYEAAFHHHIPFTYEAHTALYIEEPENGLDFALLMLDDLQEKQCAANNLVPITRENWLHQHRLTFDFYRMLGIPKQCVFPGQSYGDVSVQQVMIAVDRLTVEEAGAPPFGVDIPSDQWFIGRVNHGAEIKDIRGMSGGPIFGFRIDAAGRLLYHAVAVQSRWWDRTRTIFGCSIPYFAEAIHRQIEEFAEPYKEHEQMVAPENLYEQKFSHFTRMLAETKEELVLIHHPEVIGDNYDEIVESLNRLADAGKHLAIVPRKERSLSGSATTPES